MTHPAPRLENPATDCVVLSQMGDSLQICIPDSADIGLTQDVCITIGDDGDAPDWTSRSKPIAKWDELTQDVVKTRDFSMSLPKSTLEKYANETVQVRYRSLNETGNETLSQPLELRIQP